MQVSREGLEHSTLMLNAIICRPAAPHGFYARSDSPYDLDATPARFTHPAMLSAAKHPAAWKCSAREPTPSQGGGIAR